VIAPSRSLAIVGPDVRAEADRKLAALGLEVSFGEHVEVCDDFSSAPVQDRLADLHAAFADPGVDGILTVLGGFNSNQLLAGIDYDLVAAHPKALCGFSDITALANALYARAGVVAYSGPHYSSCLPGVPDGSGADPALAVAGLERRPVVPGPGRPPP
jgi:muramoyltetrapeptide carboxypeptidase